MNENKNIGKINPISLKKEVGFFFKKIKPISKIANNYHLNNLRNGSNIKKSNNTLNVNQKYLLKLSELSKISELNNISNINQFNNDIYNTIQTAPHRTKRQKLLLNINQINNLKKLIKYKKNFFTSLLSKKKDLIFKNYENKNDCKIPVTQEIDNKKRKYFNSLEEKNNNLNSFVVNDNYKNRNLKKELNKRKLMEVLHFYNKNNNINKTYDDNTINSNYKSTLNTNSTKKEINYKLKKDLFSMRGDSLKSINLIKENNDKILNRLVLNKDNKNININIKYFYKKNIKNINWIFYNTYNNINTKTITLKNKESYNYKIKKFNKNKNKKENEPFQHGKSYNDIKINTIKNTHSSTCSQKINLIKNSIFLRNKNNLILNKYKRRNMSKTDKFKLNQKFHNIFSHKNSKTFNEIKENAVNNLSNKPINQKSILIKNKWKIYYNYFDKKNEFNNNYYKVNRKIQSENNFKLKIKNNKIEKNNTIYGSKKDSKSLKNEKNIGSKSKLNNKENYRTKRKSNNLFLENKFDFKKIYKNIRLKIGLKENKVKEKERIKNKKERKVPHKKFSKNFSNDISYSNNVDDILNIDNSISKINNNKDFDEKEIESITKKLDFTKYNKLSYGNIFNIDNNKEYNEFKDIYELRFKKKLTILKLLNNNNYFSIK